MNVVLDTGAIHFPPRETYFEVDYLNKITDNRTVRKNSQPCSLLVDYIPDAQPNVVT